jgi:hypothetical protein
MNRLLLAAMLVLSSWLMSAGCESEERGYREDRYDRDRGSYRYDRDTYRGGDRDMGGRDGGYQERR